MADTAFPNYMDLDKISQMNPFVGGMAVDALQNQQSLAQMFAQQGLDKGQQDIKKAQLGNLFDERSMEDRLRQTKVNADYTGNLSRETGIRADIGEATKAEAIKSKMAEFAKNVSDSELAQAEAQIQQMMFSNDPKVAARGKEMFGMHREMVKMKEQERLRNDSAMALENARAGNARSLEQMRIDAGKYDKASQNKTILQNLISTKNYQQAAMTATVLAMEAETPQERDQLLNLANQMKAADIAARQAAPQVRNEGQIDVGAVADLPTRPAVPVTPFQVPGQAPQVPQPQQGAGRLPQGVSPQQAIQEAKQAISRGAPREAVLQRLQQMGVPTQGL